MFSLLLDLPTELLNHALWYLDLVDLHSCQLVHSTIYSAIKGSILLKYLTSLKASGMEDNPLHVSTSTAERLNMLLRSENGWSHLQFDFRHTIKAEPNIAWPIGLDGGVLFLLNNHQTHIHHITLPKVVSDNPQWAYLPRDKRTLDFCFAVSDHDLIAIATISKSTEIEIHLLQVSTGLPHPLAEKSKIVIADTSWQSCTVSVAVSGETLVVLVNDFRNASPDRVFIYEWKSGSLKMTIAVPHHSYDNILFLSADKILLPNRIRKTLDIWTMTGNTPNIVLEFLPFKEDTVLMGLTCLSVPNPVTHGTPHSNRPFHESPSDAIIYFIVHIQSFDVVPLEDPIFLLVFVHRRSLLELCYNATTPPENGIPWREWGPSITRLITSDVVTPQWHSTMSGERFVALNGNSEIIALDFNPARAKVLEAAVDGGIGADDNDDYYTKTERAVSSFSHSSLEYPVLSELPYTYYKRKNMGPFDSLLVDGERFLGLRTYNHGHTIQEIEVMHLG
ncbi:hypothetical protein BDZ94DRAFT_1267315 [Collybia nuda]|uniref:F-box domain-containing protein n=1 Tax=Collybia nuda TaxID=64659 RepID=A0A9P5Y273_9AGAR|nr:hypothetical protein BDZ94DRAFT_1267315 [Collybia nuda]